MADAVRSLWPEVGVDAESAAPAEAGQLRRGPGGRPRSEKTRQSILDATCELLLILPVREISIEQVAREAKVGKASIYRWWPNRMALILDAIEGPVSVFPAPDIRGGESSVQLVAQIERFARLCRGRGGRVIAELYAEAQAAPEWRTLFFEKFMAHHHEILLSVISCGQEEGSFRKDISPGLAVDMIYGSVFYRLMRCPEPLDMEFSDALVMEALRIVRK